METVGLSLQYLSGYKWNCIGYWNLITFGILLILLQFVKDWKKAAWLAYITTALAVVRHFFITLLTTTIALGMVLAIPELSTLVGVVTGLASSE